MKTILIAVKVPDLYDTNDFAFEDFVNYAQHKVKLPFKQINLPDEKSIDTTESNDKFMYSVGFNTALKQIKDQMEGGKR